jgi:purine-binding chemotaxis protein CheW
VSLYAHFSEQELEILRARAERAAAAEEKVTAEQTVTVVYTTLGSESYALSVECLRAVYKNVTVVPIPCTPSFVAGIANIRGRITPVLDLAVVLNVPPVATDGAKSLLVIARGDLIMALRVDDVGEIEMLTVRTLIPLPSDGRILASEVYLQGMFPNGATLLDVDALLNDPRLVVDHAAGSL